MFASGANSPARGLYSMPAWIRGWNLYVRVVRTAARGIWFVRSRTPSVHLCLMSCPAPLTARPSPGQSGQLGTDEATTFDGRDDAISFLTAFVSDASRVSICFFR